eukprot:evm.model.scf_100EXC.7 EVM.evm.TU.scf_100EXC.7   scf_100EXC:56808-57227(-)
MGWHASNCMHMGMGGYAGNGLCGRKGRCANNGLHPGTGTREIALAGNVCRKCRVVGRGIQAEHQGDNVIARESEFRDKTVICMEDMGSPTDNIEKVEFKDWLNMDMLGWQMNRAGGFATKEIGRVQKMDAWEIGKDGGV